MLQKPVPETTRVAIVTGASRGIGRAIALRMAEEGAAVMLGARDVERLQELAAEIGGKGGHAAIFAKDLRTPEAPGKLADEALRAFGRIDIVVNNAGATKRGEFLGFGDADWDDGFALKFYAAMRLTRAAWPELKKRSGCLVNIVGSGGRTPGAEFAIGGSVNGALLSFTKAMADLGIADGVQVNAVNPGPVKTDRMMNWVRATMAEKGVSEAEAMKMRLGDARITRIGEPEDIANMVAFVVSARGRLLQGATIDMDGGLTKTI